MLSILARHLFWRDMLTAMPMLDPLLAGADWIDPDGILRPIVTMGFIVTDIDELEMDPHTHRRGQLMFVQRGALSCEIEGGLWIVPPGSAIWIPGGLAHGIRATGTLEGYNAFIDPDVSTELPGKCCAVAVTALLRELLVRSAHLPALYAKGGPQDRLFGVLLDELASASLETLYLPMPIDPRLRRIVGLMMREPADRGTITSWATLLGMSERTLSRLMRDQTGMSFGRWRQQLGIMRAIERLAGGASIQQVAGELGYDSVPSFTAMFSKALGTSPGRYIAERYRRSS